MITRMERPTATMARAFPRFAGWGRRAGDCIGMKFSVPRARWYRLAATADRVPSGPDGVRGLRPLQSSGVDLVGEWVRKRPSRVTSLQRANRSGKTHSYPRTREGSRTRRETRPDESEEAAQPEQEEPPSRSPRTRGHRASFPRRSLIAGGGCCLSRRVRPARDCLERGRVVAPARCNSRDR